MPEENGQGHADNKDNHAGPQGETAPSQRVHPKDDGRHCPAGYTPSDGGQSHRAGPFLVEPVGDGGVDGDEPAEARSNGDNQVRAVVLPQFLDIREEKEAARIEQHANLENAASTEPVNQPALERAKNATLCTS